MLMHVCVLSPKTRWNIYWILVVFHIQFWTNWTNGNAKIFRHDQQWTAILQRWTAILTDRTMTDMRIPQWAFYYRSHNKVTSAGGLIRIGECEGFYMQLHALCKPVNTLLYMPYFFATCLFYGIFWLFDSKIDEKFSEIIFSLHAFWVWDCVNRIDR